jgi:hypothetical protein
MDCQDQTSIMGACNVIVVTVSDMKWNMSAHLQTRGHENYE